MLSLMPGRSEVASSSPKSPLGAGSTLVEVNIPRVNDSLYQFHTPPGNPTLEIIFFHGIYAGDLLDAHVATWESGDGSCIWPQAWLAEEFPTARIWSVSYCGSVRKTRTNSSENLDIYLIVENLVSDMMDANVGQTPKCPIVLVGYCFGGMVIKELCHQVSMRKNSVTHERERAKLVNFFDNVKAIFYYGTPHNGCPFLDRLKNSMESPLLDYFSALDKDRSRLNYHFELLRTAHRWRIDGLGESRPATSGVLQGVLVAPESSSRQGDFFNVLPADHVSICKPTSKPDRRFYALTSLLTSIAYTQQEVHQCQGLPLYSVGLDERALEVREQLKNNGAEVLGIVGMGGIGKTTLAKQVFNSISEEFEYTCFVDCVKGISIQELESFVLDKFYQSGKRIFTRKISWRDLEMKKTLIVMDGVDSDIQLRVLPRLKDFGFGSRLIITTQYEDIFTSLERYHLYRVDFLRDDQAEKLFCQYAGLEEILDGSPGKDQLKKNVEVLVEKCGGLPLTLEVLGCYVRGHVDDTNYWEQTIDKLGKGEPISGSRNDKVWNTLRVSYDGLARKEQKMFIEAAICFFGEPLDRALACWNGAYKNADTSWENLINRSMVKVLSVEDYAGFELKTVWVHEHLRDLAASLEQGYMVTISEFRAQILDILNEVEVDDNTKIVRVINWGMYWQRPIKLDFLVTLKKLKYLEVSGAKPGLSFKTFPKKLSLLRWELPHGSTSVFWQIPHSELTNLAVLELIRWKIPKEFPEALGNLTNLRILSLCQLSGLNHLPEMFGSLSQLKTLTLVDLELKMLPASFGCLLALEELCLRLYRLECLPDSIGRLGALKKLEIDSSHLQTLPDSLGQLARLEYFRLNAPGVALPETMGQLTLLRYLYFASAVAFLPENVGQLSSLRTFQFWGPNLKKLPDSFANLCALEELHIDSDSFNTFPDKFGELSRLRELNIRSESLESFPEIYGDIPEIPDNLSSLERLTLQARRLVRIPESFGRLRSLTHLSIESEDLSNLPASFGRLSALQTLDLTCDNSSFILPESFGDLSSLIRLKLKGLVSIPESFGRLRSLTHLSIESENLSNLPASFGRLSALQTLDLTCDNSSFILPESFGDLSSLTRLRLQASNLVSIPDSTGRLDSLEHLTMKSELLTNLPTSFGQLSALRTLGITCRNLETLPDSFGNLSSLEQFTLMAKSLVRIPESVALLSSLKNLTIHSESLRNLPSRFGELSALTRLEIHCDSLETLPENMGELSALVTLILVVPNMRRLPSSVGQLSALFVLRILCDYLENLPDIVEDASSLLVLQIHERSLDRFQEQRLALLGWVPCESQPRGLWKLFLNCVPCARLSRDNVSSYVRAHDGHIRAVEAESSRVVDGHIRAVEASRE